MNTFFEEQIEIKLYTTAILKGEQTNKHQCFLGTGPSAWSQLQDALSAEGVDSFYATARPEATDPELLEAYVIHREDGQRHYGVDVQDSETMYSRTIADVSTLDSVGYLRETLRAGYDNDTVTMSGWTA